MATAPSTALLAVTLAPQADAVWRPLTGDLAAALEATDDATLTALLEALHARCRHLARERALGAAELLSGLRHGIGTFDAALAEASGVAAATARERLRRIEVEALARAGVGYADGLEDALEDLTAEIDFLRPEDPLTGVMKESEIVRRLGLELDRCQRMDLALGLARVGVDCLDDVRAHGGPGEPDELLRRIARLLGDSLRRYDAIGRLGEEGFLVVLPDVSRRGLQSVIERFRHDLRDECPAALRTRFSFALAHLDYLDLAVEEVLAQMDGCLVRARAGVDQTAWV